MFFPESRVRVFVFGQPVDLRKSFDGLAGLVRQIPQAELLSGHLFCFFNRRGTQVRILYWDRSGLCLWSKRLEAGRFVSDWKRQQHRETDCTGLKLLLEGIEPALRRRRFSLPAGAIVDR